MIMFDFLKDLSSVWFRLAKDGVVKTQDPQAFAEMGDYFLQRNMEDPTYEKAIKYLTEGSGLSDESKEY